MRKQAAKRLKSIKQKGINKPWRTPNGPKAFAVWGSNTGKAEDAKLVRFGDPNMKIKRSDPERRKSFNARHKCSSAKDKTTPRYWSCMAWKTTVEWV